VNSSIAGRCWSMAEATAFAAASTPSTDCATCISTYVPCGVNDRTAAHVLPEPCGVKG
jgi:hypothetical protein